jgi:hypothetical protein
MMPLRERGVHDVELATAKGRKKSTIARPSHLRHCLTSFHELCWLGLLPAPSCCRRHGLQSSRTGAPTQFAPIASREHSRLTAKRPAAGLGGSVGDRRGGLPFTFRTPPAPFREHAHALGPGFCCGCGQPVYRFGWHIDLWTTGPNKNAVWHSACVVAWQFWNSPSSQIQLQRRI